MPIDPLVLSSIAASVSLLGTEYLKGAATEAGKSTWEAVKCLFGWSSDPEPKEIPAKVTHALQSSPELLEKILQLLNTSQSETVTQLVGNVDMQNGKLVVANSVGILNM
jgi:hypothetical protein